MEVDKVLNRFGNEVVSGAKKNLQRKGKIASKDLFNSLDYNSKVSKNSFQFDIEMEDYGEFIDKGVKGIGGKKADGSNWKLKKTRNTKFKYKKGIQNKPSRKHFDKWSIRKGIAPRTSGGQFQNRIGLTTAISHAVWHQGLETTEFLTQPFEKAFKKLPDDIVEAYGLQVEQFLELSLS